VTAFPDPPWSPWTTPHKPFLFSCGGRKLSGPAAATAEPPSLESGVLNLVERVRAGDEVSTDKRFLFAFYVSIDFSAAPTSVLSNFVGSPRQINPTRAHPPDSDLDRPPLILTLLPLTSKDKFTGPGKSLPFGAPLESTADRVPLFFLHGRRS